tara:strand:- start:1023 stop:1793 length:771 start_codon:yes stop_codon:yes gene_type:complete
MKSISPIFLKIKFILITLMVVSCVDSSKDNKAETIVEKAIENAGGNTIAQSSISFKFRDYYYKATRDKGEYVLERCDSINCEGVKDVLNNAGFTRYEDGKAIELADSLSTKYGNSVNSVHYFSVLPYGLDSEAVNKKMIGESTIKGKDYYLIQVTFSQEGGGDDFDDEYMYWIDKNTYTVDYLAYNYHVNEGGTRFREAYNIRDIEGVRVVDYNNYKAEERFPPLKSLDSLFENGKLELLSKIELEDVSVTPCTTC